MSRNKDVYTSLEGEFWPSHPGAPTRGAEGHGERMLARSMPTKDLYPSWCLSPDLTAIRILTVNAELVVLDRGCKLDAGDSLAFEDMVDG
ncbi:hypothetical protein AC579_737 [Pseudocercospora musae]|uniref:Uncharacterized protein n=1 Tax=Pseudocercospora musae TaxID=113226 RepID=A0A139I9E6_9PEZI|nr:hypothetical protein AC579_737 [Pseudocercospora musae]